MHTFLWYFSLFFLGEEKLKRKFFGISAYFFQVMRKYIITLPYDYWYFYWETRLGKTTVPKNHLNSTAGRVVGASASQAVDSGLNLIRGRVKPMTLNLVFTASLLDVQH